MLLAAGERIEDGNRHAGPVDVKHLSGPVLLAHDWINPAGPPTVEIA